MQVCVSKTENHERYTKNASLSIDVVLTAGSSNTAEVGASFHVSHVFPSVELFLQYLRVKAFYSWERTGNCSITPSRTKSVPAVVASTRRDKLEPGLEDANPTAYINMSETSCIMYAYSRVRLRNK